MPLQATSGAASYDAFGGGVPVVPAYIEEVFSTTLYTGNSSTQTITNGIDLSTKGGLIWQKTRPRSTNHFLTDSARGFDFQLATNSSDGQVTRTGVVTPTTSGFSLNGTGGNNINYVDESVVSWTFRNQAKFFDVQTFTYPSSGSITVPHNLASTPGCVMVKMTNGGDNWYVYHRMANNGTNPSNYILQLNTTSAQINNFASWITVGSSSITFPSGALNPGSNFVMYLFAHDAGGFGLTGTDNVISCGSFTTDGSGNATVSLGYEPQWLMTKRTDGTSSWIILDNMRQWANGGDDKYLIANGANAELTFDIGNPTATGFFTTAYAASAAHIYIAIRRGPMKVPTTGTSVFSPSTYTGDDGSNREITGLSFTPDLMLNAMRLENGSGRSPSGFYWFDRLRGKGARLRSSQTLAEFLVGPAYEGVNFRSYSVDAASGESNYNPALYVSHLFKRAPSFFDEVCGTGTGTFGSFKHNLGVAPELVIFKDRNATGNWRVLATSLSKWCALNSTIEFRTTSIEYYFGNDTTYIAPTATDVFFGSSAFGNFTSGITYVAYLFATCAGVSKVGSYTGNGSSQTINCGFTGGARFVMVKATSTTGNWIVADSARGIVAGNDPATYINIATSELTSFDWIDADNSGFVVNETSTIAANTNGVTYIFLAIA